MVQQLIEQPNFPGFIKAQPAENSKILLNGEWQFAEGPDGSPPMDGWQRVRIPHRSREFEPAPPTSGWYRTMLRIPHHWEVAKGDIILDLSRIRHYGRVYLGNRVISEHYGMRTPWRIHLTDSVEPGGQYPITIYTHNCSGSYAHPDVEELSEAAEKAIDTRFWYTSAATIGVEGDVWLRLLPRFRIDDVYVVTSVRQQTITVEATVINETETALTGTLSLLVTRDGQVELQLPSQEVTVEGGSPQMLRVTVPWENAALWGRPPYGQPVLYFLQSALTIKNEQMPAHRQVTRFGFREVWTEGEQLLLNGEPLMPWGDHSVPYVHERQWLTRKLIDLADGNISIVEHHRYDAPEILYDVADELGVFVVASNFCVGTGQVPGSLSESEMELVLQNHLAVSDAWIRRDRNHPSILFWDVTDAREPNFCIPLLRKVKSLDSTRLAEVTYDYQMASDELRGLIDTYRLFSSLEQIEAAIQSIRSNPDLPVKPIRVGEAGIFERGVWGADEQPPLMEGWKDFLLSMPQRNIHGLQTFYLTDMDYRNFALQVPGMLAQPVNPQICWPSQSGLDTRIDPFGEGSQTAWGKAAIYLNWCDPKEPVSLSTATLEWSKNLFRQLTGRDVGSLAKTRIPEVIVHVERGGNPMPHAQVFVEPLECQGITPFGIQADEAGTSWFVLPEEGCYHFTCDGVQVEFVARRQPIGILPGYEHIQRVRIDLEHDKGTAND